MPDPFGSPTFVELVEQALANPQARPRPLNRFVAQPVLAARDLGLGDLLSLLAIVPGGFTQQAFMQAAAGGFETSVERAESAFPRKVIGGGGPGEFVASIGKAKKLSKVAKEAKTLSFDKWADRWESKMRPGIATKDGQFVVGRDHGDALNRAIDAGLNVGDLETIGQRAGWKLEDEIVFSKDLQFEDARGIYDALRALLTRKQ